MAFRAIFMLLSEIAFRITRQLGSGTAITVTVAFFPLANLPMFKPNLRRLMAVVCLLRLATSYMDLSAKSLWRLIPNLFAVKMS